MSKGKLFDKNKIEITILFLILRELQYYIRFVLRYYIEESGSKRFESLS